MSKADVLFVNMCRDILENGYSSEGQVVRPRWEDGTPAHTIKRFGVVNRYDLSEEFPALTLRPTAIKSAVDELLWIWQKKSNNIKDLKSRIWDEWADESGSIGKAYGYQLGVKYRFPQGEMDQVDNVIWQLKNSPYSRPKPKVPEAVITGFFRVRPASSTVMEGLGIVKNLLRLENRSVCTNLAPFAFFIRAGARQAGAYAASHVFL